MVDLMSSGIPEATVSSFKNFRELYCTYNESLEVPLPEATIASRLAIVSRRLGTKIDNHVDNKPRNKLDARLESQNAEGNLAATVKVIISILADAVTEATRRQPDTSHARRRRCPSPCGNGPHQDRSRCRTKEA